MRTLLLVIACAVSLTGCQTAGTTSPETRAAASAFMTRASVAVGVTLALRNNPQYIQAAAALADGVDVALAGDPELTRDSIREWVRVIALKNHVRENDVPLFALLADSVYAGYVAVYGVPKPKDSRVLLFSSAFRDGIRDGLAAVRL